MVYVQRALAPAKLKSIALDDATKTATVVVDKEQVSLAIGRSGQNIRLASKLTGYEINLIKEGVEEEYDMDLTEFREELGEPLYERLMDEGYETARDVIDAKDEDLLLIDGLNEEKIASIKTMMKRELEEADIEEEKEEEDEEKAEEKDTTEERVEEKPAEEPMEATGEPQPAPGEEPGRQDKEAAEEES